MPTTADPTGDTDQVFDTFIRWFEQQLDQRGWSVPDLCENSELRPSVVFRWRRGYRPDIGNGRHLAHAFGVPLLEVLVKAGRLTPEEANANVTMNPNLSEVSTAALLHELLRRVPRDGEPGELLSHSAQEISTQ